MRLFRFLLRLANCSRALLLPAAFAAIVASPQLQAQISTQTYSYTGSAQSFVVPAGVTSVTVIAYGAQGGETGGKGGAISATIPVTPLSTLNVYVGGQGGSSGGYNGGGAPGSNGGGGGGASDVRSGGTALSNRVVVAGGGGGTADYTASGGAGGNTSGATGASGGSGGGGSVTGGGGGTQSAGGAGGVGTGAAVSGAAGSLGTGGAGNSTYSGGGGGGYYGGGGGGGTPSSTAEFSGGGGGSSYVDPSATNVISAQGTQTGNGLIVIAWSTNPSATVLGFPYSGTAQTFTVPASVTSLTAMVYGAQGGGTNAGTGGSISGTVAVTPSSSVGVYVGGQAPAGFNGGTTSSHGGGDASDIRLGGTALSNRVLVAGGGGGGSLDSTAGGNGGGSTGAAGTADSSLGYGGGGGGTQSAGGIGGTNSSSGSGTAGALGLGGAGQSGDGGDGGGGYYGGGGGGGGFSFSGPLPTQGGGGGGGGSSYSSSTAVTNVTSTQGGNSGNGLVLLAYSVSTTPAVSSVSPDTGPTAGGTAVTIAGSNFTGATAVTFGSNTPATSFTVNGDTTIFATAPAGSAGVVDVTITTTGGTSTTSAADQFTYLPLPAVTQVSPNSGPLAGGTSVTLTGSGFTGATAVTFGANTPATSFSVNGDTTIFATAPADSAGIVDVTVTTGGGTSTTSNADQYQYVPAPTVTSVGTTDGPLTGGSQIVLTGTGFTGATAVSFGGLAATSFTVNSPTTIYATVPATTTTGVVDITVTTVGGTSSTGPSDHFAYLAVPTVTQVSPGRGPLGAGTSLTITGTGFTGATAVSFGSNNPTPAMSYTVNSDTTIFATAPAGSAGVVDVTVTTDGGTSATSSADHYRYVSAPAVTGLDTTAGPLGGGTSVTLTGTDFYGVTGVSFGANNPASFTVNGPTTIYATSPAGSAGLVDVTVTAVGGTSAASPADQFTYVAAPTVTSVATTDGPLSGGAQVVLTGTGFTNATSVSFGGLAATGFTVVNDSTIDAVAPATVTTGEVNITVTTVGGTSSTSPNDQFNYLAVPTVTQVAPVDGPLVGGTNVTITGTAFTSVTNVSFGTNAPAEFTVNSPTTIYATAPAGSVGVVDVTVTTDGGTSAAGSSDHYTYVAVPTVTGVSAVGGPLAGGNTVTITGTAFSTATGVSFGGNAPASFTVNGPTTIYATAPAHSAGLVDVTVTTAGGTSTTGSGDHYTFEASPTFTSGSSAAGTYGVSGAIYQAAATGAQTFSIVSGSLPPGLAIDSASGVISGTPTQPGNYSVSIGATNLGGTSTLPLGIVIQKATASISLSGLTATYDGTAKTVTATTNPSNLAVTITYGGLTTPPTQVGSYTVVASINDPNYTGSQTGSLVINAPAATTARQFFGSFTLTTSSSVSSTPRSAAALTGSIAATVNAADTAGTIIGSVGNSAFVVAISIGSNGSFSGTTTALTVPGSTVTGALTFTGTLSGNTLSGTIAPLGVSFSMPADAAGGTSAPLAGYYQASSLDSATGSTYSIVGPQGDVLVVTVTPTAVLSGTGTVAANGNIAVTTTSGATITGNVNAPTTTLTLNVTSGGTTTTYSGVSSITERTDRLVNLSSRGSVTAGNQLISGLVIGGSANKTVLLRAVGPGLAAFNLTGVLAQPHLQLFNAAGTIISDSTAWNNSGGLSTVFAQVGAFPLGIGSADAAVEMSLAPGAYTLQVSNAGTDAGGLALAEIYDASANPAMEYQRLINISTRAFVSSGAASLTGGFVITGNNPKQVLIRGIGPGLAAFGIGNTLSDPFLTVFTSAGAVVAENDNWGTPIAVTAGQTVAAASDITAAELATGAFALPTGSKDAALIVTLPPGAYTAQVTGVGGVTGTALVEIYEIPPQ